MNKNRVNFITQISNKKNTVTIIEKTPQNEHYEFFSLLRYYTHECKLTKVVNVTFIIIVFNLFIQLESGRLFVWGENHHGQLGIGGQHSSNTSNNNSNNNTSNGDIIIKPTCVKSLKTLGLKIVDISFGNDWSIILTCKLKYCNKFNCLVMSTEYRKILFTFSSIK